MMQILFIDLENCPSQMNQLLENVSDYSQVIICYAKSGSKVPIDWLMALAKSVNEDALKIIKMPEVKKNAADFGIAFWAGVLMTQLPEDTHFDIVSNDADLDVVIGLLTSQLRSAKRIGIKKKTVDHLSSNHTTALKTAKEAYCLHLNTHSNKPAKQTTLLNSIKSKFKHDTAIKPQQVLSELVKCGIVMTHNESDKVTYNLQKLHALKTS